MHFPSHSIRHEFCVCICVPSHKLNIQTLFLYLTPKEKILRKMLDSPENWYFHVLKRLTMQLGKLRNYMHLFLTSKISQSYLRSPELKGLYLLWCLLQLWITLIF